MTISRKLYLGFGSILAIMLVLFFFNTISVIRENKARDNVKNTLADVQTIETVRFQMMQNRQYLGNYLLSGDLRDEDKTGHGINGLQVVVREGETKAHYPNLKTALAQVEENEHSWADDFAKPMIAKRHQVDAGDATVSDLQIFYLQHDPASWVNKSSGVLDAARDDVSKALEESNAAAASASARSTGITTGGTLFAILLGVFIAFYTARSIKLPLYHLIEVAHRIGESGDLDQSIDIRRNDEVGILAQNFNKMIVHLKEMEGVSAAIAEGTLSVTVHPRSQQDTMAKAFARMTQGLRDLVRQVRDSASQVASGSGQMASASDESAKVSVQASAAIEEVPSTMRNSSFTNRRIFKIFSPIRAATAPIARKMKSPQVR